MTTELLEPRAEAPDARSQRLFEKALLDEMRHELAAAFGIRRKSSPEQLRGALVDGTRVVTSLRHERSISESDAELLIRVMLTLFVGALTTADAKRTTFSMKEWFDRGGVGG